MKVTFGEIPEIIEGLRDLPELPTKPAYWLGRFSSKLKKEYGTFEKERFELVQKYAAKDPEGKIVSDPKTGQAKITDREAFKSAYEKLAAREVDIAFDPVKLDALGNVKLKPDTLSKLEKIIVE
jgi:hypothetical protein